VRPRRASHNYADGFVAELDAEDTLRMFTAIAPVG